jgi:hypothetical protein
MKWRERIVDVWLCVMAALVAVLLALWIYAAWLDLQPITKPGISSTSQFSA